MSFHLSSFFDEQAVNVSFLLPADERASGTFHDHGNAFDDIGIPGGDFK
jgi:hypothetical protein